MTRGAEPLPARRRGVPRPRLHEPHARRSAPAELRGSCSEHVAQQRDRSDQPPAGRRGDHRRRRLRQRRVRARRTAWSCIALRRGRIPRRARRPASSAAAQDDRTVRSLYPNGFLPLIRAKSGTSRRLRRRARRDRRLADGAEHRLRRATRSATTSPTATTRRSATPARPSSTPARSIDRQWTTNLDVSRRLTRRRGCRPLRAAAGAEFRVDQYEIQAGEPDSYRDGGVRVLDANGQRDDAPRGGSAPRCSRLPADGRDQPVAQQRRRATWTRGRPDRTLPRRAARAGTRTTATSARPRTGSSPSRFTVAPGIRAARRRQHRLPRAVAAAVVLLVDGDELHQRQRKPHPVRGEDVRRWPALGARPRRDAAQAREVREPERRRGAGAGAQPLAHGRRVPASTSTIASCSPRTSPATAVAALLQPLGGGGARYFTNAIDTRTNGLDVVGNYGLNLGTAGFVAADGWLQPQLARGRRACRSTPPAARLTSSEALFGRVERARIEEGQPRDNCPRSARTTGRAYSFVRAHAAVRRGHGAL